MRSLGPEHSPLVHYTPVLPVQVQITIQNVWETADGYASSYPRVP